MTAADAKCGNRVICIVISDDVRVWGDLDERLKAAMVAMQSIHDGKVKERDEARDRTDAVFAQMEKQLTAALTRAERAEAEAAGLRKAVEAAVRMTRTHGTEHVEACRDFHAALATKASGETEGK